MLAITGTAQRRVILYAMAIVLAFFALCGSFACAAAPVPVETPPETPLGRYAAYFKEDGAALDIAQAIAAYRDGKFRSADAPMLNFGIGSRPVWIAFEVENRTRMAQLRRLSVETSWLDHVDAYFPGGKGIVPSYRLGDALPFGKRPIKSRFFDIDHTFGPGVSQVFIRVETSDPMVVPIYLRTPQAAIELDTWQHYSYGLVYGFLLALMAYNAMLYASLRSRRYIYYSIYLAVFVLMNVAYTGHGYEWLWPEQVGLQLWVIPFLMALYGMSGLLFAGSFLNTRAHFPRMHRAAIWLCALVALLLLVLFALRHNALHMKVAFAFCAVFPVLMLLLGVMAIRAGHKPAWYFLFGAICAMTGALLTDLSVAGVIPFNDLNYRAVEMGMLGDAVLLALALAHQFRVGQNERFQAELMARVDVLTGLSNRRAFYEAAQPVWSTASRNNRDVSVILFDIDGFKQINDTHGHAAGDEVLIAAASIVAQSAREGDVAARWGGEEFILFLPETSRAAAVALAERLRAAISEMRIEHADAVITFTASFGVAQKTGEYFSVDELISVADKCLYQAKNGGKNRVSDTFAA